MKIKRIELIKLKKVVFFFLSFLFLAIALSTFLKSHGEFVSKLQKEASGIVGETIYINDSERDLNYYKGLNYTTTTYNALPSGENQNIYNEFNLVETKVIYSGEDINNGLKGYVSNTESQYLYVYYNYFPVNNNGTPTNKEDDYILIELIDNPFSNRPSNKAFNGWYTNYTNGEISFDNIYYERFAKIPITYDGDIPDATIVNFYASWTEATTSYITTNNSSSWNNALNGLKNISMVKINTHTINYKPYDLVGYYKQVTVPRNSSCSGYYDYYGSLQGSSCYCNSWGGCTYYSLNPPETEYLYYGVTPSSNYYYLVATGMTPLNINTIVFEIDSITYHNDFNNNFVMSGYYEQVIIPRYSSITGLYDNQGNLMSGTCNSSTGCTLYRLIQYADQAGNANYLDIYKDYYYLVTRDTNIVVMNSNNSYTWNSNTNPFTLTTLNNGSVSGATWTISSRAVNLYSDVRIENINIYSASYGGEYNPSSSTSTTRSIYGNGYNLKLGRGITAGGSTRVAFRSIIGGTNSSMGSSSNPKKYKLIVESGPYSSLSLTNGASTSWSTTTNYVLAKGIYGNDYDRITQNNSNLTFYFCAGGSWSGNYYSNNDVSSFNTVVKSGSFGTLKTDYSFGIYIGGRYAGTHYTSRMGRVEGGYIYNLIAGPLTDSSRENLNDSYIYIMGGNIDAVFGGAGLTATYGNRIIQLTGGKINYNVFGGSNAYTGSEGDGTLRGNPFIYVGGNVMVGDPDVVAANLTLYGATAGNVFGIGNGRNGYSTIGTAYNSFVIIDEDANVLNSVYGGGNFGATGISGSQTTTQSKINVLGGTISQDIYGGGNRNGSGSTSKKSQIYIKMLDGNVLGSIYGGSNFSGTIHGSTNLDINGGTVAGSIYGGGKGGVSGTNSGTFVSENVVVNIGDVNYPASPIVNRVYGGSALGVVNGTVANSNVSPYTTTVNMNKGTVEGALFGGGEGDQNTTPYVLGNVTVNINGGTVNNALGANDVKGTPNGTITVNLNGGTVNNLYGGGNYAPINTATVNLNGGVSTNVFGGCNRSDATTTNVNLKGSTIDKIYGGSNESGTVNASNIITTSGKANQIYGGNNLGGTTLLSYVTLNGGEVPLVYGGGNEAISDETNVVINGGTNINTVYGGGNLANVRKSNVVMNSGTVGEIYGGGNQAGITESSNIRLLGGIVNTTYGGSNQSGTVVSSNIETVNGTFTNIYGGNNYGGLTQSSNLLINGGSISNIFGGGNHANSTTSNVILQKNTGTIINVYGGGNEASVTTSNVIVRGGVKIQNLFGGSNRAGDVTTANVNVEVSTNKPNITYIYGGNNQGGITSNAILNIDYGNIKDIYGGGNNAPTSTVNLNVGNADVSGSVFGGGNQSFVENNVDVKVENTRITNSIYGGGNLGEVRGNIILHITDSIIGHSVYGGGNGQSATVYGNTTLNVDGVTTVTNHIFGGGNAAVTGRENLNNSSSVVNIAGLTCGGNVYGGANTSVLYGVANVNIGANTLINNLLKRGNINIGGTVFGGGEANASGSEVYDFTFISVTVGINIKIDAESHSVFNINGSIFGSGNASSTSGYSNILIKNYGTEASYKKNVSIQRAQNVTLSNSVIELNGATDRTNEYSDVLFSISRVDSLKLTNNSVLYLETGTNLLKKFTSSVIVNNEETPEIITIDDNGNVTRNVNNKLFVYGGKNINIATNENITAYGEVVGMTFFGMYGYDRDGKVYTAIYKTNYNNDSIVPSQDLLYFDKGSYVLGLHKINHNYEVDGFYSVFNDKNDPDRIYVDFVEPTPEDSNYYIWAIGEQVASFDITLTASKYSTLGIYELPLINFSNPNTAFSILNFNYDGINSDINLVEKENIPRVADNSADADRIMSLVMESSDTGWVTDSRTTFLTNEERISGSINYKKENSSGVPTLLFYLYHSKNLQTSGEMGTGVISLVAIIPIDDLNNEVKRININVTLNRALYQSNEYEGTISSGKKYEMFPTSLVNITSTSSFSTYYSLYAEADTTIYKPGYHRVLSSTYNLPENTKITMIDLREGSLPEYYYYVVTAQDYIDKGVEIADHGDAAYKLSKFIKMGSTTQTNNYDDAVKNQIYWKNTYAEEEFIFIFDFKNAEINEDVINKMMILELRSSDNQIITSVIGIQQQQLIYNIYTNKDPILELNSSLLSNNVYLGDNIYLNVRTNFTQSTVEGNLVVDTNYQNYRPGLKITMFDSLGRKVTGPNLMGISYKLDGKTYYPRFDGTVRINTAERVANVSSNITIETEGSNLADGNYKLLIESFSSFDGIYYGLISSDQQELNLEIKSTIYGLKVNIVKDELIISEGKNLLGNKNINVAINYESGLANPNIRVALERRDYNTIYSSDYFKVNFKDFFSNAYQNTNEANTYLITNSLSPNMSFVFNLKDNLQTGTYKIRIMLYDNDTYIGEDSKYMIIKR